ncbi:MAG: hypothetical protein EBZ77_07170 [Chitinophagia bacterium]|nr:hypothetical protein [Chitinophagia bacterium]
MLINSGYLGINVLRIFVEMDNGFVVHKNHCPFVGDDKARPQIKWLLQTFLFDYLCSKPSACSYFSLCCRKKVAQKKTALFSFAPPKKEAILRSVGAHLAYG